MLDVVCWVWWWWVCSFKQPALHMSHLFAEGEMLGKQMLLSRAAHLLESGFAYGSTKQHGAAQSSRKQHKAAPSRMEQQSVGAISSSGNIATSTLEIGPTSTSALGNIIDAITNTCEGKV